MGETGAAVTTVALAGVAPAALLLLLALAGASLVEGTAIANDGLVQQEKHLTVFSLEQEKAIAGKPGSHFQECGECPVMTVIAPGKFLMGSSEDESEAGPSEFPKHQVTISQPFAVSIFEVTFEQWDACAAAGACTRVPEDRERGLLPVINVSWYDAKQYTAWLSSMTGKAYRLLTEAEWEYAARAGSPAPYSWGADLGNGNANCDGCGSAWDRRQAAPVGSFAPNAFGIYDMLGNVWEWVEDCWHDTYKGAPKDGSAWISGDDTSYSVVRGGSWRNDGELVRAAVRAKRNKHVRFDTLGFRVARALNP